MKYLLSLDMSTTCTGWSLFDIETHKLITYGILKGKNIKDSSTQRATLRKMEKMAKDILLVIEAYAPSKIIIEEIAGSRNRIGQKTLDMLHGIVWKEIDKYLDLVEYYDVSGTYGWRTHLNLKLSEQDKIHNKESRKFNKEHKKNLLPVLGWKHLSCRYANLRHNLALDCDERETDGDIADSVSIGDAYLLFRCPKD